VVGLAQIVEWEFRTQLWNICAIEKYDQHRIACFNTSQSLTSQGYPTKPEMSRFSSQDDAWG